MSEWVLVRGGIDVDITEWAVEAGTGWAQKPGQHLLHEFRATVFVPRVGTDKVLPLELVLGVDKQVEPPGHSRLVVHSLCENAEKLVAGRLGFDIPEPAETGDREVPADVPGLQPTWLGGASLVFAGWAAWGPEQSDQQALRWD